MHFSEAQWAFLTGTLGLQDKAPSNGCALAVEAFTTPAYCRSLLDELGPLIGSPTRRVTASLLCKRLSFLTTGVCLYALSACNRGLDLSPANCLIDCSHDGTRWTSVLPLHDTTGYPLGDANREGARQAIVRTLFADLLAPLWSILHQVSGVPRRMLWENTAVRVYSLYERRLTTLEDRAAQARCESDFSFLVEAAPSQLGLAFNPLQDFLFPRTRLCDGRAVRFRRTCCLYFQATCPASYCQTCPLLRTEQSA